MAKHQVHVRMYSHIANPPHRIPNVASHVCVCVHCYSHAENYNWTVDDYARYVFRIHAPKTMHVMFSEFMRQRLLNSRGLQGMS